MRRTLWALLVPIAWSSLAYPAEIGPTDDLAAAVAALVPGEELVLRGGTYAFDENLTFTANGTAARPITIRAKRGEQPILKQVTTQHNVVEINGSSHLVVRDIEFTGGSHGIRLMNSDDVTIEGCVIHATGDVAISANAGGTYERLKILRNHIHHTHRTGEGIYLGCHDNSCRVTTSLIEGNYIHHTDATDVVQGDGIEIKEGSHGNIIRGNVIHDTLNPGIIVFGTAGYGPANVVEGNVIWNVADNAMQIAADAIVRNNIVLGNVSFQSHANASPSNIQFIHNTVINAGPGIEVRNVSGPVLIANNAVFSETEAIRLVSGDLRQVTLSGNVGAGGLWGGGLTAPASGYLDGRGINKDLAAGHYAGAPPIDAFPASGSTLISSGHPDHVTATDFNGSPRGGRPDVGAYHFDADGNPGWAITQGFKAEIVK